MATSDSTGQLSMAKHVTFAAKPLPSYKPNCNPNQTTTTTTTTSSIPSILNENLPASLKQLQPARIKKISRNSPNQTNKTAQSASKPRPSNIGDSNNSTSFGFEQTNADTLRSVKQQNQLRCNDNFNRLRERLFRLLSKVPIQVETVEFSAASEPSSEPSKQLVSSASCSSTSSFSSQGSQCQSKSAERKPLLIKYYNERSFEEILNLHFGCSLMSHNQRLGLETDEQSNSLYRVSSQCSATGTTDEDARIAGQNLGQCGSLPWEPDKCCNLQPTGCNLSWQPSNQPVIDPKLGQTTRGANYDPANEEVAPIMPQRFYAEKFRTRRSIDGQDPSPPEDGQSGTQLNWPPFQSLSLEPGSAFCSRIQMAQISMPISGCELNQTGSDHSNPSNFVFQNQTRYRNENTVELCSSYRFVSSDHQVVQPFVVSTAGHAHEQHASMTSSSGCSQMAAAQMQPSQANQMYCNPQIQQTARVDDRLVRYPYNIEHQTGCMYPDMDNNPQMSLEQHCNSTVADCWSCATNEHQQLGSSSLDAHNQNYQIYEQIMIDRSASSNRESSVTFGNTCIRSHNLPYST